MVAAILAIVAGLIGALPQILKMIEKRTTAEKEKRNALAKIELDDTQRAMADVDRQLDGVQPPGRKPVLLPPDRGV
jgi:hypothetical protein